MKDIARVAVLLFILSLVSSGSAFAAQHPLKEVLGISTATQLPATAEGPGFIMPHSNLYFLDKLKQQILLTLSLSQARKINMYNAIAGERLAELRIEIEDGQELGINTALSELTSTVSLGRKEVETLQRNGSLKPQTAQELNDDIKDRYIYLVSLEDQVNGSLKEKIKGASRSLLEDKIKLASLLPTDVAKAEAQNDIELAIAHSLADVKGEALILKKAYAAEKSQNPTQSAFNKKQDSSKNTEKSQKVEKSNVDEELDKILEGVQILASEYNKNYKAGDKTQAPIILLPSIIPNK